MNAVEAASLAGTWVNEDPATPHIVMVVLDAAGEAVTVHAFGACVPRPCDWGRVAGQAYAAGVAGGAAVGFTALYQFDAKTTLLTGRLDGDALLVASFDVFHDGSGRAAATATGRFARGRAADPAARAQSTSRA